jgi:hypothetical protein
VLIFSLPTPEIPGCLIHTTKEVIPLTPATCPLPPGPATPGAPDVDANTAAAGSPLAIPEEIRLDASVSAVVAGNPIVTVAAASAAVIPLVIAHPLWLREFPARRAGGQGPRRGESARRAGQDRAAQRVPRVPRLGRALRDQDGQAQGSGHKASLRRDGETRTRTGDTTIFSRVLYQLSYLAAADKASGPRTATRGGDRPDGRPPATGRSTPRSAGAGPRRRPSPQPIRGAGRRSPARPPTPRSIPPRGA